MLIGRRPKMVHNLTRDFVLRTLGTDGNPVHYVQVGANDGRLDDPVFKIARDGGWSGLLIEPNPLYFMRLSELYAGDDGMCLVNCAVSDEEGELTLFHLSPDAEAKYPPWAQGCATLDRERLLSVIGAQSTTADDDVVGTPVTLRRLDAILADNGIERTDLLVIDVEGHELNVLRSVDLDRLRPKLLLVEANRGSDGPVRDILAASGYRMHRIGDDLVAYGPDYPQLDLGDMLELIGFQQELASAET